MRVAAVIALLLLVMGCDDQGLPPDDTLKPAVTVQFLEASCTEVWLRLAPRNVSPPYTLTLLRNDSTVATFSSPPADTTVIDEGLAPSRTYTYRARLTSPSGLNLTGDPVQARTLDTTSHLFTWETTVLGDGGSSIFYDVAIVNDTLAYAVGEVYLRDSSGVLEILPYNFARWDGLGWRMERVTVPTSGGPITVPLRGICAFSEREIWLSSGIPVQKTATGWRQYHLFDMGVLLQTDGPVWHVWGSSSSNLYFAGDRGTVAHFDGLTWRRVESGTQLSLVNVWGASNGSGRPPLIAVVACNLFQNQGRELLSLSAGGATRLPTTGLPSQMSGLWFVPGRRAYAVGAGIYQKRDLLDSVAWTGYAPGVVTSYFSHSAHGQRLNDVVVAGSFGEIVHFNGMTWRNYIAVTGIPGNYISVKINGRHIFAVGDHGRIAHGIRP